jgi:ABC-2 type transport system ATP-binding protein
MRQKVKFASAIVHDPEFLILDEPTTGLDPEEREQLLNRVRTLADTTGKSVLLSTHILPDVQQVCDQVIILAQGQVRLQQSFAELNRPASPMLTVQVFGESRGFMERLRQLRYTVTDTLPGEFNIESNDPTVVPLLWKIAAELEVTIQALRPARNSLEEIFIGAVQESGNAHP